MSENESQEELANVFEKWHEHARNRNVAELLELYDSDAILESPLISVILDQDDGICHGRDEIRHFLEEGTNRRPNDLVQWYRTGTYFSEGNTLIWEYPRQTPDGEQVDIIEVMEIEGGKIIHQRIYWGWFGFDMLQED